MVANLDDIEEDSIKGVSLKVESKGEKAVTREMPLSRDVVRFGE